MACRYQAAAAIQKYSTTLPAPARNSALSSCQGGAGLALNLHNQPNTALETQTRSNPKLPQAAHCNRTQHIVALLVLPAAGCNTVHTPFQTHNTTLRRQHLQTQHASNAAHNSLHHHCLLHVHCFLKDKRDWAAFQVRCALLLLMVWCPPGSWSLTPAITPVATPAARYTCACCRAADVAAARVNRAVVSHWPAANTPLSEIFAPLLA